MDRGLTDTGYSTLLLPDDAGAAAEEVQRRREGLGFSYFAFGADVAGPLAPVVAEPGR